MKQYLFATNFDYLVDTVEDNIMIQRNKMLLDYSEFSKVKTIGREPFGYRGGTGTAKTFFSFGPLVAGLLNELFFASEISLFLNNFFGSKAEDKSFFTTSKPNYNSTEGVVKRLLKNIEILPGLATS